MKTIRKIISSAAIAALIAPAAYANTPDCTDDHNGTISPVQNLVRDTGCYIYASDVEPNSTARSIVKLLPANDKKLDETDTASEIIGELNRLAIYSPGYGSKNVTTLDFVGFNRLAQITNSVNSNMEPEGVAVLAVNQQVESNQHGVEDSAYVLQATLNFVNNYRSASAGEMAVLGYSLGGVAARYALADMEAKSIPHNVGLYVSNDAPHRGAYIPQSCSRYFLCWSHIKMILQV